MENSCLLLLVNNFWSRIFFFSYDWETTVYFLSLHPRVWLIDGHIQSSIKEESLECYFDSSVRKIKGNEEREWRKWRVQVMLLWWLKPLDPLTMIEIHTFFDRSWWWSKKRKSSRWSRPSNILRFSRWDHIRSNGLLRMQQESSDSHMKKMQVIIFQWLDRKRELT